MVGQVADILTVFEGDGKGQGVKGSSPSALCWTKVVSVGENWEKNVLLYVDYLNQGNWYNIVEL